MGEKNGTVYKIIIGILVSLIPTIIGTGWFLSGLIAEVKMEMANNTFEIKAEVSSIKKDLKVHIDHEKEMKDMYIDKRLREHKLIK